MLSLGSLNFGLIIIIKLNNNEVVLKFIATHESLCNKTSE